MLARIVFLQMNEMKNAFLRPRSKIFILFILFQKPISEKRDIFKIILKFLSCDSKYVQLAEVIDPVAVNGPDMKLFSSYSK